MPPLALLPGLAALLIATGARTVLGSHYSVLQRLHITFVDARHTQLKKRTINGRSGLWAVSVCVVFHFVIWMNSTGWRHAHISELGQRSLYLFFFSASRENYHQDWALAWELDSPLHSCNLIRCQACQTLELKNSVPRAINSQPAQKEFCQVNIVS